MISKKVQQSAGARSIPLLQGPDFLSMALLLCKTSSPIKICFGCVDASVNLVIDLRKHCNFLFRVDSFICFHHRSSCAHWSDSWHLFWNYLMYNVFDSYLWTKHRTGLLRKLRSALSNKNIKIFALSQPLKYF